MASDVLRSGGFVRPVRVTLPTLPTMLTCPTSPTILIVEDDEVLGQVLAKVLTRDEQIALHVRTADEALQFARSSRLRLVLIDAGLREGTPMELADAIQGTGGASVSLIWLATHRLENSALLSRGERLITKSIDLPELRRAVAAALLESPGADRRDEFSGPVVGCRS